MCRRQEAHLSRLSTDALRKLSASYAGLEKFRFYIKSTTNRGMRMNLWVFRVNRGYGGGNPEAYCPTDFDKNRMIVELAKVVHTPVDYSNAIHFIVNELFQHGRLRQGWGVPGLDLRLPEHEWAENYIVACYKYWEEEATCIQATGRRLILAEMLDMQPGDIIFIPNIHSSGIDESYFTVGTVKDFYQFESRNSQPIDFGHIIGVSRLKSYIFSNATLPRSVFGAPFMRAIDPIKPHWQSYPLFVDFLRKSYLLSSEVA
jgi:hypothetical protein